MNTAERHVQSLEMKAAYEAGASLREIAARYGMTAPGVQYRLVQYGTQMRAPAHNHKPRKASVDSAEAVS